CRSDPAWCDKIAAQKTSYGGYHSSECMMLKIMPLSAHAAIPRGLLLRREAGLCGVVPDPLHSGFRRAMGTAVDLPVCLDPMTDDPAMAVGALRRHRLNFALEAVERHRAASLRHVQSLVVVVTADIATRHGATPLRPPVDLNSGVAARFLR